MKIGIIGIGFMGMIHFLTYAKLRSAKVVALCEQVSKRLRGDWRDIKGNFGPRGSMMDLSGLATYSHIESFLDDPSIELVDICLPPALHADAAIRALQAGKHVFCEKPIALSDADGRRMARAAQRSDRLLMIGHVLPMFPEFRFAHDAVQQGTFGKLLGGRLQRVINDPTWLNRYYDPDWIGGPMLDLHIHDAHYIRLLFGMPHSVHGVGRMHHDVAAYFDTQFSFDDPELVVTARGGVVDQAGRPFLHGFELHFEHATLVFESGVFEDQGRVVMPLTILPVKGRPRRPRLGDGDPLLAFRGELQQVVRAVQTGHVPEFLSHELALDALRICNAETQAIRTRKPVRIT